MRYSLVKITDPSIEPVSLNEAKSQLRISTSDDDVFINSLIKTARIIAENFTKRALIKQSHSMFLDEFPASNIINIPILPIITVTNINIYAEDNTAIAQDLNSYIIDKDLGRVTLKDGYTAPIISRKIKGLEIIFDAGYGLDASDVPEDIKQAILMLVVDLYENRGENIAEKTRLVKTGAEQILQPYRILKIGG